MPRFFCDILVEARTAQDLTQKQVAEKLGITASGYQKYEYGVRVPTGEILLKLIKLYELDLNEVQASMEEQLKIACAIKKMML